MSALALAVALGACSSDATPGGASGSRDSSDGAVPASDSGAAPADGPSQGDSDGGTDDVSLLAALTGRFPAANASATCADAPLHLVFSAPVALGTAGKIQLWRVDAPGPDAGAPVDTIDMAATAFTATIGGRVFNRNRPVLLDGQEAIVAFQPQAMVRGATYEVTIDSGVFVDAAKSPLGGLRGASGWRFTTSARAPTSPSNLTVAADGTGDFCTVQGAVDAVPAANASPLTITVKKGVYREIVFIAQKNNITLHGEDRKATVIAYANNNTLNPHTNTRAMVEVEGSNDLVIENITLHNLTAQGGSQAEALRVEPADRVILRDADFISTQDTLLLTGRVYVTNCYVEGNVDFIWGKGTAYFDRCELKTVGRAGYEVQARNPAGMYGYVFVDSTLTSSPGLTGNFLARVDVSSYPASQVAYLNCKMDKHIDPKGWLVTGAGASARVDAGASADAAVASADATLASTDAALVSTDATLASADATLASADATLAEAGGEAGANLGATALLRFAEYQSTDLAGQPIDVSKRIAESKQLTAAEAAMMRDKTVVLGGWNP